MRYHVGIWEGYLGVEWGGGYANLGFSGNPEAGRRVIGGAGGDVPAL